MIISKWDVDIQIDNSLKPNHYFTLFSNIPKLKGGMFHATLLFYIRSVVIKWEIHPTTLRAK